MNESVSCGACCGLYNVPEPGEEGLYRLLLERSRAFGRVVRSPDSISRFGVGVLESIEAGRPLSGFHHCPYLGLIGPGRTPPDDAELPGVETAVGAQVLLNDEDRAAMVALFAEYLEDPPRSDPQPKSYRAAAARLDVPRSTLVKRIEYLRARLDRAGVPNMTGFNALASLAEYALARRLITKDEVDRQIRHQQRLALQSLYIPSPPRRRFKGFPRSHSEEELSEMVRRLEELESAILVPEAERLEDILEMDGHEYGLEMMEVYECLEHDALEEGFVLIEIEEEAVRPMGEVQEFAEAYEEDFVVIDLEEFASIRPLGLAPTIADEIDIEPMEIDF